MKVDRHYCEGCRYFIKTGREYETWTSESGKLTRKLKPYSFYCIGDEMVEGYPQFIKTISCFTGLTPMWCPRMKEREAEMEGDQE